MKKGRLIKTMFEKISGVFICSDYLIEEIQEIKKVID